MPRFMAPPPSGEFNVTLAKPFTGKPTETIQITGEPNRSAQITTSKDTGSGNVNQKVGQMSADDVNELLSLLEPIKGFPSSEQSDIYGLNTRLEYQTMEINWTNAETDPAANVINEVGDENKETFKDVVQSIEAAGRTFAKKDNPV